MIITKLVVRLIQGPLFAKLGRPYRSRTSSRGSSPAPANLNFAGGGLFTQCDYYHSHPLSNE
jgi:hypothetical protein